MKLKFANENDAPFTPFQAIFEITSREEAIWFHNEVMIKIGLGPCDAIGEASHRIRQPQRAKREFEIDTNKLVKG